MHRVLEDLEPKAVFHYFEDLSRIPHGSRNTKAVSDYCVAFAKQRGLWVYQDELNNVIIKKPASAGYEAAPAVILQGHLDMVAEKTPESPMDFTKDALDLRTDGETVWANGTTLGGDDGIAVAMALAVLDSDTIAHPALEAVFTVDEEIGMEGAQGLDYTQLHARRMLNIDSEDEGIFTVSCAGGASAHVSVGLTEAPCAARSIKLCVSGLIGGHSGQEINKGRANANILLGRVLQTLLAKLPARLVSAAGGSKDNAIPNAAEAVLAIDEADLAAAEAIAAACDADFKKEYAAADPGVLVTLTRQAAAPSALTEESTRRVADFLLLVPNGIAAMSMDIAGLVQTSCNLGIFSVAEGVLTAVSSVRSSVASQKQMLLDRFDALAGRLGGKLTVTGAYPAWEYRRDSVLRDKMAEIYKQQTGKDAKIEAIHAGLECGLFAGALDGLDCVSFGPDLVDIHTTREKMLVPSVQRTWRFLLAVLAALDQ